MTLLEKQHLLCEPEDLNLDLEHLYKNLGIATHVCDHCTGMGDDAEEMRATTSKGYDGK